MVLAERTPLRAHAKAHVHAAHAATTRPSQRDIICRRPWQTLLVFTSALAETFLRKLAKAGYIGYKEGTDEITTADDEGDAAAALKPMDTTTRNRLEKVRGMEGLAMQARSPVRPDPPSERSPPRRGFLCARWERNAAQTSCCIGMAEPAHSTQSAASWIASA